MKRSHIFPLKKEGQLIVVFGLGFIFILQNLLLLRVFLEETTNFSGTKLSN